MILVIFILISSLVVYFSIRLSFYADELEKQTTMNSVFIGGVLVAGITSLPELVTCFSSILLGNNYLAIGDILGSNFFNVSIMCFLDIIFIKKYLFRNIDKKNTFIYISLLIIYFIMYFSLKGFTSISFFNLGIPTFIIFLLYGIYLYKLKQDKEKNVSSNKKDVFILVIKFIITSILIVITSVLLTLVVNKIAMDNPSFSSSLFGALLLGIVTSFPEVITFISLMKMNNFDMALSDIIGSNFFNLLVLAIGDILTRENQLYYYSDKENILILTFCFLTTIVNFYQVNKKNNNKISYLIPSLIVVSLYILFLIISF